MSWKPNSNTTATNKSVTLNTSTFTQLVPANSKRLFLAVTNPNNDEIIINCRTVATAVDDEGLWIPAGSGWEIRSDGVYNGEVCAIAVSGAPVVLVLEF